MPCPSKADGGPDGDLRTYGPLTGLSLAGFGFTVAFMVTINATVNPNPANDNPVKGPYVLRSPSGPPSALEGHGIHRYGHADARDVHRGEHRAVLGRPSRAAPAAAISGRRRHRADGQPVSGRGGRHRRELRRARL